MCWIASVRCCTAENCWTKPSTVSLNSPAWEIAFISARLSQRWRSWTTMVEIAFPRDRAVNFAPRNQSSSREGSGLGGLLTSSPILTAGRASMAFMLWVRCGGGDNTRGGQPHRTIILIGREPIPRCCDQHPILGWHTELNAGMPRGTDQ